MKIVLIPIGYIIHIYVRDIHSLEWMSVSFCNLFMYSINYLGREYTQTQSVSKTNEYCHNIHFDMNIPVKVMTNPTQIQGWYPNFQPLMIDAVKSGGIPHKIIRKSDRIRFSNIRLNGVRSCKDNNDNKSFSSSHNAPNSTSGVITL